MGNQYKNLRKHLSADSLLLNLKTGFKVIEMKIPSKSHIPLSDVLMGN